MRKISSLFAPNGCNSFCHRKLNLRFTSLSTNPVANENAESVNEKNKESTVLQNKEILKRKRRAYYVKNKEKECGKKKEYYQKNRLKMIERQKEYNLKNKEKLSERQREYLVNNKETEKERQMEYYIKNKDKVKKRKKEYYLKNKEKVKERKRDYKMRNNEMSEKQREYYIKNKKKLNEGSKEYKKKNKEKVNASQKKYFIKKKKEKNEIYIPRKILPYSWKDSESIRENFDSLAKVLDISEPSDWYRISNIQLQKVGAGNIFREIGSLKKALKMAYPEFSWDSAAFNFRGKKSAQRWLYVKMKKLLPNATIIEDFHHPDLVWDVDNKKHKYMQLDIWIAEYKLALEYQGEQHFYDIPGAYGPGGMSKMCSERDEEKEQKCIQSGITLVSIPYWWDGDADSLCSTLNQILPDVFPKTDSPPIPTTLPSQKTSRKINIPSF